MSMKIGSFQVLGTLGKGANSTILHIRRSADSTHYALKVVPISDADDQKFLTQAEHEFEIGQKLLDHPNLIKVFAMEKSRTMVFFGAVKEVRLLIEYVNGRTLDTFKIIPLPQLLQIFVKVASGLTTMHRRNICHGDMKPSNIMLSKAGDVKILDYGLAWLKGEEKGRVQGTPEYIAPEQVSKRIVNEHTDIFNFGATMYRLVTWKYIPNMIAGQGSLSQSKGAYNSMLKPVRELNPKAPKPLADLIEKCIKHSPQERPERMSEVQGDLDRMTDALVKNEAHRLENWEWSED
jgi:eukaryotic-like serine/threonine-protein kinase